MKYKIVAILLIYSSMLLPVLPEQTVEILHDQIGRNSKWIMGCDITNTDVIVGLFEIQDQKPKLIVEYQTKSRQILDIYLHLQQILNHLLLNYDVVITDACFSIPGIMKDNGLFLHPHLPWNTSDDIAQHSDTAQKGIKKQSFIDVSGLQNIYFINDFQAVAMGVQLVDQSHLMTLQQGKNNSKKPKLVIGAGNGLGASLLLWDSKFECYVPAQLNYSFTEFGAQSNFELAFFKYLKDESGNIAWGKVLGSAGGIKLMYKFFNEYGSGKTAYHAKYGKKDQYKEYENYLDIFKDRHVSMRCKDCVDFYVNLYARLIRNAAYAQAVYGGVYLVNSVVQGNQDLFATDFFMRKITDLQDIVLNDGSRRYLEGYLSEISFYVVTDTKMSLYGAAMLCMHPNLIKN